MPTKQGNVPLNNVQIRLLNRALSFGHCDPSDPNDPNFTNWRQYKAELILSGLLTATGQITTKGQDALKTGRYRRSNKGTQLAITLDELTISMLDAIMSEVLMTTQRSTALKYCINLAYRQHFRDRDGGS